MSEIRDTEVDSPSSPEGPAEGDEKIMSVLSPEAVNQQKEVRTRTQSSLSF